MKAMRIDRRTGGGASSTCTRCGGERWVCEEHPRRAWRAGFGCCGAPGMACACNPMSLLPAGAEIVISAEGDN